MFFHLLFLWLSKHFSLDFVDLPCPVGLSSSFVQVNRFSSLSAPRFGPCAADLHALPEADGDATLEAMCDPASSGEDSITGGKATTLLVSCNVVFCEFKAVNEFVHVGSRAGDDGAVAHGLVSDVSVTTLSLVSLRSMSFLSRSPPSSALVWPLDIELLDDDSRTGENGTFVSVGDSSALCV